MSWLIDGSTTRQSLLSAEIIIPTEGGDDHSHNNNTLRWPLSDQIAFSKLSAQCHPNKGEGNYRKKEHLSTHTDNQKHNE